MSCNTCFVNSSAPSTPPNLLICASLLPLSNTLPALVNINKLVISVKPPSILPAIYAGLPYPFLTFCLNSWNSCLACSEFLACKKLGIISS